MISAVAKKKRTNLTRRQHDILLGFFQTCAFPDAAQKLSLSKLLNMNSRSVQVWFQNQRQKIKMAQQMHGRREEYGPGTRIMHSPVMPTKSLMLLADLACWEYERRNLGGNK